MRIPDRLRWLERSQDGRSWLAELPARLDSLCRKWGLQVGDPFESGNVSYVTSVRRDGEEFVLKIQWPHEECRYEAEALRAWDGNGAVRLVAHDIERHALLLEKCSPGCSLAEDSTQSPCDVFVDVLPRLWKDCGPPFKTLRDEAREWKSAMVAQWMAAGQPCERELVDSAMGYITALAGSQREQVLVHQDLHGDNILKSKREPHWLVIDPKPLLAEPAFSLAPVIRSSELGHTRKQAMDRFEKLSSELGLDKERVRGWTIAQTMAWSFESPRAERHFETVRWLLASR